MGSQTLGGWKRRRKGRQTIPKRASIPKNRGIHPTKAPGKRCCWWQGARLPRSLELNGAQANGSGLAALAPSPPAMSAPMWLQAQPCHFGTVRFLILQLEGCRRAGVVPLGASTSRDPRRAHAGRHGAHGQPHEAQRQPRPRGGPFVRERQWSSARKEEFLRRSNAFAHWTPTSKQTRLPWRGRQPRGGEDPISSFVPGLLFFFFFAGGEEEGERQGKGHKSQPDRGERSRGAGCRWGRPPRFAPSAGLGPALPLGAPQQQPPAQPGPILPGCGAQQPSPPQSRAIAPCPWPPPCPA